MIDGNTKIQIQIRTTTQNRIGEDVEVWKTVNEILGFIDLSGGDSKYSTYNAKIQESTHLFISDYYALDNRVKAENSRVVDEKGKIYDVMLIDDPMELHEQLEIYLKYTGGQ